MSDTSDARKKSSKPREPQIDAYELADDPAPAKPQAPPVNRSYLIETEAPAAGGKAADPDAQRFASARKMMLGEKADVAPDKLPPLEQPKLVDSATLARKREEARRKNAEDWAREIARQRKKKMIVAAVALVILLIVAAWVRSKLNGAPDPAESTSAALLAPRAA